MRRTLHAGPAALAMLVLVACTTTPSQPPPPPSFDAVAAVAAIRAAGNAGTELVVTPLGASEVADLREDAQRELAAGRLPEAAALLDEALGISPHDPALLQERAELALLLGDFTGAAALVRRAIGVGSGVGPHCRRHWETLAQLESAQPGKDPQAVAAAQAHAREQRDACTVAPPPRY